MVITAWGRLNAKAKKRLGKATIHFDNPIILPDTYALGFEWASKIPELPTEIKAICTLVCIDEVDG